MCPAGPAFAGFIAEAEKRTDVFQTELDAVVDPGVWSMWRGVSREGATGEGGVQGMP